MTGLLGRGNIDQPAVLALAGVALTAWAVVAITGVVASHRRLARQRSLARQRRHEATVQADETARPVRLPGQELEVEFTAGPEGHGLLFHDVLLAQVVGEWTRELEGGAR